MNKKDLTVPLGNSSRMNLESEIRGMKSVHEVCLKYSISRKTLYYYDQIGLLKPTQRTGVQKAKLYGPKALKRLEDILLYQNAGLTLKEINEVLEVNNEEKIKIIQQSIQRMKQQKKTIQKNIDYASSLVKQLEESLKWKTMY